MTRRVRVLSLSAFALGILPAATILMSGCSGNNGTALSTYVGSYGGIWLTEEPVTGTSPVYFDSGGLSFTVDTHGNMTGSFVDPYGVSSLFDGKVQNNGSFSGTITRQKDPDFENNLATVTYPVSGTISPQQVNQTLIETDDATFAEITNPTPLPSAGASPTPTPGPNEVTGVSGDFRAVISGTTYAGEIYVTGGQATSGG